MAENFITGNKEISFKQIVLSHLQKILEISTHELRDSSRTVTHSNFTEEVEHEDTRISYVQAVESLAYILQPYFDKEIKEVYKKSIKYITAFNYEMKELLKEHVKKVLEENTDLKDDDLSYNYYTQIKLRYAKELFAGLNLFMERKNYLTPADYISRKTKKK